MSAGPDDHDHELGRRTGAAIAFAFAALLHGLVGFVYLTSGLVVPAWALLVLLVVWSALATLVWQWRRRGPIVLAIPFVAAGFWVLTLWLGDRLLGWTA